MENSLISKNNQVQLVSENLKGEVTEKSVRNVIPVNETVLLEEGLVNQSSIKGELLEVEKMKDTSVFEGTVVQEVELFFGVRAVGNQIKFQNILTMIDNSQALKASS